MKLPTVRLPPPKATTDLGRTLALALPAMVYLASATAVAGSSHEHHDGSLQDHSKHQTVLERKGYYRAELSYAIPDVVLVDMNGEKVNLNSVLDENKPVMLQFIFTTCPAICPVLSAAFAGTQKKLVGELDEFQMISISIDPEHDTPAQLRAYAKKFSANSQWRFLTGRLQDVLSVQAAFDAYRGNKMSHEPLTFLRASTADPWIRLDGLMSATELIAEYRRMSEQRISKH